MIADRALQLGAASMVLAGLSFAPAASLAQNAQGTPVASPSPSPSPTPRPGTLRIAVDAHTTFVSQAARGPGIAPPEAAGFANGDPLSPLTPYDVFSSAPIVSGNALESAIYLRPTYFGRRFDVSLLLGAGHVRGSTTNSAYWGESLIAPLNPHLGSPRV